MGAHYCFFFVGVPHETNYSGYPTIFLGTTQIFLTLNFEEKAKQKKEKSNWSDNPLQVVPPPPQSLHVLSCYIIKHYFD